MRRRRGGSKPNSGLVGREKSRSQWRWWIWVSGRSGGDVGAIRVGIGFHRRVHGRQGPTKRGF